MACGRCGRGKNGVSRGNCGDNHSVCRDSVGECSKSDYTVFAEAATVDVTTELAVKFTWESMVTATWQQ